MARGISIGDVENKVQHISDNNVIPLSTGADVPEVVTVGVLKEHINEDVNTALEGKQDVINDLAAIRSGAALGATAVQIESDPTVPSWAKESQKPSYSYSEITGKPTLATVATSGSYNDLTNKPDIPSEQIQSDWNQSNDSSKDYIKNKPTIPTVPTNVSAFTNDAGYLTQHQDISGKANSEDLAAVAFSGDYEDLTNTPTIPDVPEWAMSSTKPSYTVSEIDGAQEELVSGTNIKTINGTSVLGSGNITIQSGGGGDVNVIESITFNGSAVPVDGSKNAAITYSAPVTSVNGNTGAVTISVPTKVSDLTNDSGFITSETEPDFNGSAAATITSADITAWNGKSTFSGSYNDLTDKPTLFSGAYADLTGKPNFATVATSGDYGDLSNKPTIPTVPTNVSAFTNDAGYITGYTETDPTVPSWAKASSKPSYTAAEVGALPDTTAIPTESTVSGWGFTKNAGTVTSVTVNGSTYNPTNGDVDLGTIGGGGGTSVQSDWAQTDNTASDFVKNKPSVSNLYYAAWTATSSNAGGKALTDTLVLPEGVYILRGQTPTLSKALAFILSLTNITTTANTTPSASSRGTYTAYNGQNYLAIFEILFVGSGGGEVYLASGSSTSTTYSNINMGYLAAFKIA